jgi:hypothetical protein
MEKKIYEMIKDWGDLSKRPLIRERLLLNEYHMILARLEDGEVIELQKSKENTHVSEPKMVNNPGVAKKAKQVVLKHQKPQGRK